MQQLVQNVFVYDELYLSRLQDIDHIDSLCPYCFSTCSIGFVEASNLNLFGSFRKHHLLVKLRHI